LKVWLARTLVAGSVMMPNVVNAWQDMIRIENHINKSGDARYDDLLVGHRSGATEGYGTWDTDYVFPAPWSGQWAPKITTKVDGHDLEVDRKPIDSVSKFESDLTVIIQDSQAITGTNKLGIYVYDTASTDFFDPQRHYVGEYKVYSNYTANAQEFLERKNLRELCTNANVIYEWMGPTNFVVNTTTNGTFDFGKYTQFCDWNQITSSKSGAGNGTNTIDGTAFDGSVITNYDSSAMIGLNANTGNYIDKYILTRTDNIGSVNVVTNDISGQDLTSTNIPLNNIKGSNAVEAIYSTLTYPLIVSSVGEGTNNPNGTLIMNYGANTNINMTANEGQHIQTIVQNNITNNFGGYGNYIKSTNFPVSNITASNNIKTTYETDLEQIVSSIFGNGTITPAETNYIAWNGNTNFSINANPNYEIADIKTNGASVGITAGLSNTNYTWNNITQNGTIEALFDSAYTTNGINKNWLRNHGITNTSDSVESQDPDIDGFNNLKEWICDTDPTNTPSHLQPLDLTNNSPIGVVVYDASTNSRYHIEENTNKLSSLDWREITNSLGNNSNLIFEVMNIGYTNNPSRFFRVNVRR